MAKLLQIVLPVKAHVRKYLEHRHGDVLRVSRKHTDGKMLLFLLRGRQHDARFDSQLAQYVDKLTIEISRDQLLERGCRDLSSRTIYDFNSYIDDAFRDDLRLFVATRQAADPHVTLCAAVASFLEIYDITESELDQDTLLRDLRRQKPRPINPFTAVSVRQETRHAAAA